MKRGEFTLVGVILAVIVVFMLIYAGPWIYRLFSSDNPIEKCRASVNIKAVSLLPTQKFVDVAELDLACHTIFYTIKEDGLYNTLNKEKITSFSDRRFEDDPKHNAKTIIAESMKDCWYMFGKGEIDPFSKLGGSHCVECFEIRFDEELRNKVPILDNFGNFLITEEVDNGVTYADYIYSYKTNFIPTQGYSLPTKIGQSEVAYGVVYYSTDADLSKGLAQTQIAGGTGIGCLAGTYVGFQVGAVIGAPALGVGAIVGGIFGAATGALAGCTGGLTLGVIGANKILNNNKLIGIGIWPVEEIKNYCGKIY